MPGRCALLTGGAGYVGSHVNKALNEAGWSTVIVDDLSAGHRDLALWGSLEVGSLLDSTFLHDVFDRHQVDAVLHFAGLTSVADSVRHPETYAQVNVEGSRLLLGAMRSAGVDRLVFSSSAAVYGHPHQTPIPENAPLEPLSPYGANKVDVERFLGEAQSAWGLHHVSLRYFNAAGADGSGAIGEWHVPETHLIPLVLDAVAGLRDHVDVFGTDYDTPDGTCVRDYIHVSDLAEAHVLALEHALGGHSGAFNLGTGAGASVREVIDAVRDVTGHDPKVVSAKRRPGDPPVLVADSTRARSELGWMPGREDLRVIVKDAWRWHRALGARGLR